MVFVKCKYLHYVTEVDAETVTTCNMIPYGKAQDLSLEEIFSLKN